MFNMLKTMFVVHPTMPVEAQEPNADDNRRAEVMRDVWRRAKSGREIIEFYRSVGFECVISSV